MVQAAAVSVASNKSLLEIAEEIKERALSELRSGSFPFSEHLSSLIAPLVNKFHCDVRNRIYPPEVVIFMMVSAVLSEENTLQSAIIKNNAQRVAKGLKPASLNTAAFSEARQRLETKVLKEAVKQGAAKTITEFSSKIIDSFWEDLIPFVLDGSTAHMNDTAENQAVYPQHGMQKEGIGFPILRMLILQSLQTGMVCSAEIGPYKGKETGEMALARKILVDLPEGALLIGDRYFPSYFMMSELLQKGCHGLFQSHAARGCDFRRGKKLGDQDHLVEWKKPPKPSWMSKEEYNVYPEKISLREVNVSEEIGQKKSFVLVTTLLDNKKFTKNKISAFYKRRWKIELAYRDLKDTFGMGHISANTPEMVEKLFWNHLLSYNTLRWHMLNISVLYHKPIDQISVKTTSSVITKNNLLFFTTPPEKLPELFANLYQQIAQVTVGVRPGRSEPRAVKQRPKPFPRLQTKRCDWHANRTS